MRKIVMTGVMSFLMAAASSGFACQCDSCGVSYSTGYPANASYVQPAYSQPAASYPTASYPTVQAGYSQPVYAQQMSYAQSSYAQSSYAPSYAQSYDAQPSYTQTSYAPPSYAQPVYAQPSYAMSSVASPSYMTSGYSPSSVMSAGTYANSGNPINSAANFAGTYTMNAAPMNYPSNSMTYASAYPMTYASAYPSTYTSASASYRSFSSSPVVYGNSAGTYASPSYVQPDSFTGRSFGTRTAGFSGGRLSSGLAQQKAAQAAQMGLQGHIGGGYGGNQYEGVGWSTEGPQQAIQRCCYWGQRSPAQVGVSRGADGCWYACVLYR